MKEAQKKGKSESKKDRKIDPWRNNAKEDGNKEEARGKEENKEQDNYSLHIVKLSPNGFAGSTGTFFIGCISTGSPRANLAAHPSWP